MNVLHNFNIKEREKIMNKTEFYEAVAKSAGESKVVTAKILAAHNQVIMKMLKKGETVQDTGFGTWSPVKRSARNGRNPATGKTIKIAACKAPKFKAGKVLKDALR